MAAITHSRGLDSSDHQILVEADFIANATKCGYDGKKKRGLKGKILKTASGEKLLQDIFCGMDLKGH